MGFVRKAGFAKAGSPTTFQLLRFSSATDCGRSTFCSFPVCSCDTPGVSHLEDSSDIGVKTRRLPAFLNSLRVIKDANGAVVIQEICAEKDSVNRKELAVDLGVVTAVSEV